MVFLFLVKCRPWPHSRTGRTECRKASRQWCIYAPWGQTYQKEPV